MPFKYQKPYALIELSEADSETHVILSNEHYEFKDVRFYTDADLAIEQSEALQLNGVKTILLNTHALMAEFYKHEADCLAAQIGIDVNYDVKQQGAEMSNFNKLKVKMRLSIGLVGEQEDEVLLSNYISENEWNKLNLFEKEEFLETEILAEWANDYIDKGVWVEEPKADTEG